MRYVLPLVTVLFLLFSYSSANAQLISGEGFLRGDYLEVGISNCGTIGAYNNPPVEYHDNHRLRGFALVADSDKDGWNIGSPNYCGDYIMPGTHMSFFMVQTPFTTYGNGNGIAICTYDAIHNTNITLNDSISPYDVLWEGRPYFGVDTNLIVKEKFYFDAGYPFLLVDVTFVNETLTDYGSLYYSYSLDPDFNYCGGNYTTKNVVEAQYPLHNYSVVSASPLATDDNDKCYIGLVSGDPRARAAFGGFNMILEGESPKNIWDGSAPNFNSGILESDQVISIAFKIEDLAAGDSTTFTYAITTNGNQNEIALAIIDTSTECYAKFDVTIDSLKAINLYSYGSSYLDTSYNFFWTFGDGNTSTDRNPTHTYAEYDDYNICLVVSNDFCADTFCLEHKMTHTCEANFVWSPIGPSYFFDEISDFPEFVEAHFEWNFDDGTSSNRANPVHEFTKDSTYSVCVIITTTARNGFVCTDTICKEVIIAAAEVTNILSLENHNRLAVYPNPTTGLINVVSTVDLDWQGLSMFNSLGEDVLIQNILKQQTDTHASIDCSNLSSGIYFLNHSGLLTPIQVVVY